jgi:hypothetical protein
VKALFLVVFLGGCASVPIALPEVYTKPEVDAINTEAQCKLLARTMVQIARCETGRR